MKRAVRTGLTLAAVTAAGVGGFWFGARSDLSLSASMGSKPLASITWLEQETSLSANATVAPSGAAVLYYRDPDGRPLYSAEPQKTEQGRDYVAVHDDREAEGKPAAAAGARTGDAKKILFYRNPMGLPDTSPVPKKDSMGMDYIPVFADGDDDPAVVRVSPGKLQRTGVQSETASDHAIVRAVRVPGTLQPDERRISVVATRSEAFIDSVSDVTTGNAVRKGEPLLQLFSPEINAAAAQLIANPGYDGSRRRLQNLGVQDSVIAEIERSRTVPLAIKWYSPRSGVVLERNAVEGMKAAAGDALFRIADLSVMWILADVPEYEIDSVRAGQDATIRVRSLPGRVFKGRVALVYPQVDKQTRTTKVRIEIGNADGVLRPDMYADVEIATGTGQPVLAVPDSAIIDTGTKQIVILDMGDGRFKPQEVSVGRQGGGLTEIKSGLADGSKVVVSANFLIDAESNLKAALGGMTKSEAQQ